MVNSMLNMDKYITRDKNKAELRRHLLKRIGVIQNRYPRTTNELAVCVGVSHVTMGGFLFGGLKTYYKSLCLIERWIALEEERLGIDQVEL